MKKAGDFSKAVEGLRGLSEAVVSKAVEGLRGRSKAVVSAAVFALSAGVACGEGFPPVAAGGWAESAAVRFDGRDTLGGRIAHATETLGEPDGSATRAWDTTALADGWHEVQSTALDGDRQPSTAALLSLNSPSIAVEGGRLQSNVTWDASATHLVRHAVVVPSGVTLEVAAGTVVKFLPGTCIKVEDGGKLVATGAKGSDVIFTTAADDTAGATIPGAAEAGATTAVGGIRLQSGAASFSDNGWFQLRGVPCNASNVGSLAIHGAEASRARGVAYVGVTVGGNARNQAFTAEWEVVPGTATFGNDYTLASGRLSWNKSGDGTKWIAIPLNAKTEAGGRRTFKVRLKTTRGMTGAGGEAAVEVREYDDGALGAEEVAFFPEGEGSAPFAIDEPVWKEPMFRHGTEPIRMSGAWQNVQDPATTVVRLSWENEDGGGVLAEAPGDVPGVYEWRAEDWDIGAYTLRHDILDAASGRRLASCAKTFAVPDWSGVELHGGTVSGDETWRAGVVHVVYETVFVPALYTIKLEPGAIVKFLTGTGIAIEPGGGALFANGVVFTHVNDDTVGGDTLNDGATLAPVMDAYEFSGALTIGDESELRYKTQSPLSGTITASRKLTRGSTYRVSGNVTVANGATLTIPAGTVLKFDPGVQMTVNAGATLLANGTRAAPVVFTSIKDDEFGGDTNGDGGATWPQGGDWQGLLVYGKADLSNAHLLYGGPSNERGIVQTSGSGALTMDGCVVAHAKYDGVWNWGGTVHATNCVVADVGLGAAPYRGSANDYVNCVFYGCNDVLMYWSSWTGKPRFLNCVFADMGIDWCNNASLSAFGAIPSGVTTRNCVFWDSSERLSVPPRVGAGGNIWGDPRFRDPGNGDFRIREGSACIDAADAVAAPERDVFGQKRWTWATAESGSGARPDAGVAECVPRGAASDVDLVAAAVTCGAATAKPGQTLFFHWTVANDGGEAVDGEWWDEIALVSASGRVTPLGEKCMSARVAAGGVATGTGHFRIPALAEGVYGVRLLVNSRRDVAEGSRLDNNALVADGVLAISVPVSDAAAGATGAVGGDGLALHEFDLGEGSAATLVRVRAPAGSVVRWGLGFAPAAGAATGEAVVDASGEAVFAVPEGTATLYVALEGGGEGGAYDIVFEDGSLCVASAEPSSVPRSGRVTLRVAGAGFGEDAALSFVASSGATVMPVSLVRESAETLWATVDCAALAAAGARFSARVASGGASATLSGALAVTGEAGRGVLRATLSVPGAVRRGYPQPCRIVYANDGNADLPAPVLQVAATGGGALDYGDARGPFGKLQFVGAGGSSVAGVLRPGEERTLSFRFRAGENGGVYLYASEGQSWYEAPWTDAPSMFADIVAAATRIGLRGGDPANWELVRDLAAAAKRGEPASAVCGRVVDRDGAGVEGVVISFVDTNAVAAASATTDASGRFVSTVLPPGEYAISFLDCVETEWADPVSVDGTTDVDLGIVSIDDAVSGTVHFAGTVPEGTEVRAASLDGGLVADAKWKDGTKAEFRGLPAGWYRVEAKGGNAVAEGVLVVGADESGELELEMRQAASLSGVIAGGVDPMELGIVVTGRDGSVRVAYADDNGAYSVTGLSPGAYSVQAVGKDAGNYEVPDEIEIGPGESATVDLATATARAAAPAAKAQAKAAAVSSSGDYVPGSNLWFWHYRGIRDDLKDAIADGRSALDSTAVFAPWPFECEHNLAKQASDAATYAKLQGVVAKMESLRDQADRSYFAPVWKNGLEAIGNTIRTAKELQIMFAKALDQRTKDELMEWVDRASTVAEYLEELAFGDEDDKAAQTVAFLKDKLIPDIDKVAKDYERLCSGGISGVWDALAASLDENRMDPLIDYINVLTELYEEVGKVAKLAEYGSKAWAWVDEQHAAQMKVVEEMAKAYQSVTNYLQPAISYLKAVADLLRTEQAWEDGYAGWMDDSRRIEIAMARFKPIYDDFRAKSASFNRYHENCPADEYDIPLFDDWIDSATPEIPQSIDPNEVVGPAGDGDPETERFVKPGQWLDYAVYFENATNATAAAVQVRVTEQLSPHLDWDSLELVEVAFGSETDRGLAAAAPPDAGVGAFRSAAAKGVLSVPEGAEDAYAAWVGRELGSAWRVEGHDPGGPGEPGEPVWTLLAGQGLLLYAAGLSDVRWTIDVALDEATGGVTLLSATTAEDPGAALALPDPVFDEDGVPWRIVAIGEGGELPDAGVFEGLDLGGVVVPAGVVRIAPCAFANCASLESVTFAGPSPALRTLGEGAFFGCSALSSVNLADAAALESVGSPDDLLGVFESCWSLPAVSLPPDVSAVGAFAFADCSRLRSVSFGETGGAALADIGERAFWKCDMLSDFDSAALLSLRRLGEDAFAGLPRSGVLRVAAAADPDAPALFVRAALLEGDR